MRCNGHDIINVCVCRRGDFECACGVEDVHLAGWCCGKNGWAVGEVVCGWVEILRKGFLGLARWREVLEIRLGEKI